MLKKTFFEGIAVLLLLASLSACDDDGATGPDAEGTARVSLLLTDAPGDLEAAVVTITDVYLQGGEGRVYLLEGESVTTDLLTLANDVMELVEEREIPAGTYSQLRFVISGAYIEVGSEEGGSRVYATTPDYAGLPPGLEADGILQCPSCAQSGFKVLLGPLSGDLDEAEEGDEDALVVFDGRQTILVDFDVSRSFGHEAGRSGKWVMRPTLKATRLVSAGEVVVRLGLADPAPELPLVDGAPLGLASFEATLSPATGGDPRTAIFTDADGDGVFEARFGYLFPGEYHLGLAGIAGVSFLTDAALPVLVDVAEGSEETVDLLLTEIALDASTSAAER